jgi:uncharacterized membrane protein
MSICNDQESFNTAFNKALKQDCSTNDCRLRYTITIIIALIFYIWAVTLALRITEKEHRVLHVTAALAFGPLYVLAYYLA